MLCNNYSAIDIARYIINKSHENNNPVSNLKLQKILYFIQGNFFLIKGAECFREEIHAWNYGPVVPSVYREFKGFGSNYIPKIDRVISYDVVNSVSKEEDFELEFINSEDEQIINDVIHMCEDYSAIDLVELTHDQTPWIVSYKRNCDNIISKELIKEFFING